jgi:uncharacterized protein (TIGR03067 family)
MAARLLLVLTVIFGLIGIGHAQEPKGPDLKDLQGTWTVTAFRLAGKEFADEVIAKVTVVIEGDSFTVLVGNQPFSRATLKLDAAKKPAHIDLLCTEGPYKGQTHKGIIQLDKGVLMLCHSAEPATFGERPTAFSSTGENRRELAILEKMKK